MVGYFWMKNWLFLDEKLLSARWKHTDIIFLFIPFRSYFQILSRGFGNCYGVNLEVFLEEHLNAGVEI